MTIRSVTAIPVSVPFEIGAPKPMLAGKPRQMDMLLIRVETDQGAVGWGEGFGFAVWPSTKAAIESLIEPLVVGRDEADIGGLLAELGRKLHLLGRTGPVVYALSGFEIALWDLAGKAAGKSVVDLLGGAQRDGVPSYASLMRYTDPEAVARNAAAAVAQGFKAIKLHEITLEPIRRAREAIGPDIQLMVDVNCAWSVEESLAVCREIRALDILWLEEPVWPPEDHGGLSRVRREGRIPTAAGENALGYMDFKGMFAACAVDYAQPSVTKIGGISELLRVATLAREAGVTLAPHSPYIGPGLVATAHVLASMKEDILLEYCYCETDENPLGASVQVAQAMFPVSNGPGLGCDPDLKLLAKHTIK